MKPLLLVPVLFCAAPILSLVSPTAESVAHRVLVDPVVYEGKIAGWSVSADGTVAVRLVGTRDNEEFSLWFATPASKTSTTRFESLALDAVLAFVGPLEDALVTLVSDSSNQESGKSVEDALTITSIGHP